MRAKLPNIAKDFFEIVKKRPSHLGPLTHSCMIGSQCHVMNACQLQVNSDEEEELLARIIAYFYGEYRQAAAALGSENLGTFSVLTLTENIDGGGESEHNLLFRSHFDIDILVPSAWLKAAVSTSSNSNSTTEMVTHELERFWQDFVLRTMSETFESLLNPSDFLGLQFHVFKCSGFSKQKQQQKISFHIVTPTVIVSKKEQEYLREMLVKKAQSTDASVFLDSGLFSEDDVYCGHPDSSIIPDMGTVFDQYHKSMRVPFTDKKDKTSLRPEGRVPLPVGVFDHARLRLLGPSDKPDFEWILDARIRVGAGLDHSRGHEGHRREDSVRTVLRGCGSWEAAGDGLNGLKSSENYGKGGKKSSWGYSYSSTNYMSKGSGPSPAGQGVPISKGYKLRGRGKSVSARSKTYAGSCASGPRKPKNLGPRPPPTEEELFERKILHENERDRETVRRDIQQFKREFKKAMFGGFSSSTNWTVTETQNESDLNELLLPPVFLNLHLDFASSGKTGGMCAVLHAAVRTDQVSTAPGSFRIWEHNMSSSKIKELHLWGEGRSPTLSYGSCALALWLALWSVQDLQNSEGAGSSSRKFSVETLTINNNVNECLLKPVLSRIVSVNSNSTNEVTEGVKQHWPLIEICCRSLDGLSAALGSMNSVSLSHEGRSGASQQQKKLCNRDPPTIFGRNIEGAIREVENSSRGRCQLEDAMRSSEYWEKYFASKTNFV